MTPLVPTTPQPAAPPAGGWTLATLFRDMVGSWIAHHQRLAEFGLSGDV